MQHMGCLNRATPFIISIRDLLNIIFNFHIPSGKRLHNYGKSPCYQWVNPINISPFSIAFCNKLPEGKFSMESHGFKKSPHFGHRKKPAQPMSGAKHRDHFLPRVDVPRHGRAQTWGIWQTDLPSRKWTKWCFYSRKIMNKYNKG